MSTIVTYDPVLFKTQFVKRYKLGEFGNASPTWSSPKEFLTDHKWKSAPGQLYHMRNRVQAGETFYNLSWKDMWEKYEELLRKGVDVDSQFYVSAMAPHEHTVIQGELVETPWPKTPAMHLLYTMSKKPMREALAEDHRVSKCAAEAMSILNRYVDETSLKWMFTLLERYPLHTIEFSTFSVEWGTVPGFKTVFWEVRKY